MVVGHQVNFNTSTAELWETDKNTGDEKWLPVLYITNAQGENTKIQIQKCNSVFLSF